MNDQAHADAIRSAVQALRQAIADARAGGLTVDIPMMLVHWLDTGTAPGEPSYWTIKRESL